MKEDVILSHLLHNEEYNRKVIPFLKTEYFQTRPNKIIFGLIDNYIIKYNKIISKEAILSELHSLDNLTEDEYKICNETIISLKADLNSSLDWLVDETEKYCQERAVFNAIMDSIKILDKKDEKRNKGSIPQILAEALSVSFDTNIGHDFIEDADKRFDFYHLLEEKIGFDLDYFNRITKGGIAKKTLNIILASCVHPDTNVKIRYRVQDQDWIEKETKIKEIKNLLDSQHEIEVSSPDGWVGVNFYVEKGMFQEFRLITDNGYAVSCNAGHLFKTSFGWCSAKDFLLLQANSPDGIFVNTEKGFSKGKIYTTGSVIPIVDINVNHHEHRYFTNGVESHNTGVGKTMFMTHCAAHNLNSGKNVLYITMEMSEERIAERIDANMMDITIDTLKGLSKEAYNKKINKIKKATQGKLIVKEYPTAAAGSSHFRHLLQELKVKKGFKPDIIYVDYLNICASSRAKIGGVVNSYLYVKAIAEELRGLAVEFDVPIVSATQSNRDGYNSSDVGLDNTSESFALPATADIMFALISTDELEERGQIMVKQLKNRYNDLTINKRFVIGVDKSRMKFYDVDQSEQEDLLDGPKKKSEDKAVMDKSNFGERYNEEETMKFMTKKAGRKDFSGLRME